MTGDSTQKVSLGCGTLILIALIVLFFSGGGGGNQNTRREITDLKNSVTALRQEVSALRQSIQNQDRLLRERLPTQATPAPRTLEPL